MDTLLIWQVRKGDTDLQQVTLLNENTKYRKVVTVENRIGVESDLAF